MQNGHSKKGFLIDAVQSEWASQWPIRSAKCLFVNPLKSSPTVRMRKGRCKLQWIATNIFILFGLIFIIIELELMKKEINTIKKQTQKGTGFSDLTSEIVTNIDVAASPNWPLVVTDLFCSYYFESLFWTILQDFCHGQWVNSIWNLNVNMRVWRY